MKARLYARCLHCGKYLSLVNFHWIPGRGDQRGCRSCGAVLQYGLGAALLGAAAVVAPMAVLIEVAHALKLEGRWPDWLLLALFGASFLAGFPLSWLVTNTLTHPRLVKAGRGPRRS